MNKQILNQEYYQANKEKLKLPTILGTILGISGLVSLALAMK